MSTTGPEAPPQPGPPPPPPAPSSGPRTTRDDLRDLSRLRRTAGPYRKVGGVAGGLARHLDIDPVILRVAFVVLVFFGGSGLLLYGAGWLLLPEDGAERAPIGLDDRSRTVALVIAGGIGALLLLGDSIGRWDFPWLLLVFGGIALLVLVLTDRDRNRGKPTAPPVPHQPDPATGALVPSDPPMWDTPATATAPPTVPTVTRPLPPYAVAPQPTWDQRYRPRNPRKRGPLLFFPTALLALVGLVVLGVLDLAGTDVAPAAYPAVVVAACGLGLLLGAFWGRAGGLILVGLLAAAVMGATASVQDVDATSIDRTPLTAADVPSRLSTGAGEVKLDLTQVGDLAALDGRTVDLDVTAGRIEVLVPDDLTVRVRASISGPGHLAVFDLDQGGVGGSTTRTHSGGVGAPAITIVAHARAGEIDIDNESARYVR